MTATAERSFTEPLPPEPDRPVMSHREVGLGGKSGIDIARERASTPDQQGATA